MDFLVLYCLWGEGGGAMGVVESSSFVQLKLNSIMYATTWPDETCRFGTLGNDVKTRASPLDSLNPEPTPKSRAQ